MCTDNESTQSPSLWSLASLLCVTQNASLVSWHYVDHSNNSMIYDQDDLQWFYLCLMFLKLSHKSSWIERGKRWFSLPPPCISSSSSHRQPPTLWRSLPVCRRSYRDEARSELPLDDPLRYIWCQREQLVFLFSLWFPLLLILPLISPLVWSTVALLDAGLRGRRTRLMASREHAHDIQAWDEA